MLFQSAEEPCRWRSLSAMKTSGAAVNAVRDLCSCRQCGSGSEFGSHLRGRPSKTVRLVLMILIRKFQFQGLKSHV